MDDTNHPGVLIRTWRRRAGHSQAQLGGKIGLGQQAISVWERGGEVPASHWPALATALQLSDEETEQLRTALLDQYVEAA